MKTIWNTTIADTDDWSRWKLAVWLIGQAVVIAGVVVGLVLLVCR